MERLEPVWCLPVSGPPLVVADVFARDAPVVLDIGIGLGDALVEAAVAEPGVDVIGVDVHTPGIVATLGEIESNGLHNVRLVHGDAFDFLARVHPATFDGVRIFFPDPWPKAGHRHRRIATIERIDRLVVTLRPGGWLHLATDIDDYAAQVERVCGDRSDLLGGRIERPSGRPLTRYEHKGLEAGRSATDLWYAKR
jgi:tRNA (guanine-N7-)-methyltransferase